MPESSPDRSQREIDLSRHRTLLVDNQNRPLNYPLSVLNLQDTIRAIKLDRAEVVEWSSLWVHGVSQSDQLPNIMRLRGYRQDIGLGILVPYNRYNLFIRDGGRCQYTGNKLEWDHPDPHFCASVDHVLPQSYGGKTEWLNCVLCSAWVNNVVKGDKTLKQTGLQLANLPWEPTAADMLSLWAQEEFLARYDIPLAWMPYVREIQPTIRVQRIKAGELYPSAA